MGKTFKDRGYSDRRRGREFPEDTIYVSLSEVHIAQSTWDTLLERDHGQIERMRQDFENDRPMVRVVLRPRVGGGYNVEDGRHRVIAATLAGAGFIEARIVGS